MTKKRIGILGAGQLALMLAQAGKNLGVEVICAGQSGDCAEVAARVLPVDLANAAEVKAFAAQCDVLTIESENIDAAILKDIPVYPPVRAIAMSQDRLPEKRFFQDCGIKVAPFAPVENVNDLIRAVEMVGLPAILKTRRMGYDGKGQIRIVSRENLDQAWNALGGVPCILEGMVVFEAEVSLIAARNVQGQVAFYPLAENFHRDGILRFSVAPFNKPGMQKKAELYLLSIMEKLDYVGVLAVEFFVCKGELLANEMAPRVHNSGHWTIEGAKTSQFENHLRAILGMPLGDTQSRPTVMLNCLGAMPPLQETSAFAGIARHDYGKAQRPNRKVGHLTMPADDSAAIEYWQDKLNSA